MISKIPHFGQGSENKANPTHYQACPKFPEFTAQIFSHNSVLGLPCGGGMGKTVVRTAGDARFHSSVARLRGY